MAKEFYIRKNVLEKYNWNEKNVVIPEDVTRIGSYSFYNCSNINSIKIPEGVVRIGASAFSGCSNLSDITIPQGVTKIERCAFEDCRSLSCIMISEAVTRIEDGVFERCSSLVNITIPEGVKSIGSYAFNGCSSLSSVIIPEGVNSIGSGAFYGCSSLSSVIIPEGVNSIGSDAFSGCSSLKCITIPEGVTSIGDRAFNECSNLISITIPDSVTEIGNDVFRKCEKLREICINNFGLLANEDKIIAVNDFVRNGNNDEDIANNYIKYIVSQAGKWIQRINEYPDIVIYMCNNNLLKEKYIDLYIEEFIKISCIEAMATLIAYKELNKDKIEKIEEKKEKQIDKVFTKKVKRMDNDKFENYALVFDKELKRYFDEERMLKFLEYKQIKCAKSVSTKVDFYIVSDSITTKSAAYKKAEDLEIEILTWSEFCAKFDETEFVKVRKDVDVRKDRFIKYLGNESSVTIPAGVASIENYAFESYKLNNIMIPSGITQIGDYAFGCYSNLERISVDEKNSVYDSRNNCNALINTNANKLMVGCKNTIIPEGVISIGDSAFKECCDLICITIPEGVINIGYSAFKGCSRLNSIIIPKSVTSIENFAFENCGNLSRVVINNSEIKIGFDVFENCKNLTEIIIDNPSILPEEYRHLAKSY